MNVEAITLERIDPSEIVKPKNLLNIWRGKTDMYPLSPLGIFFILQEHLARYHFASTIAKGRTLDIACGTGYGSIMVNKGKITSYIGADINDSALRKSHKRILSKKNCNVLKLDANLALPFCNNSINTVVSYETIEHLQNPKLFLQEVRRVLVPGGIAILSTPNKNVFSPGVDKPVNKHHHHEYSFKEFNDELESVFSDVEFFSQGNITESDQLNPSSTKSRIQRMIGMINGSQTKVSVIDFENTGRYFIAVCQKF